MASPWRVEQHIKEAKANYDRYELMLTNEDNAGWGAVFLFYSAIHLVQALAHRDTPNDIPNKHEQRQNYVANHMPADMGVTFTKLYLVSRQVRYDLIQKNSVQVRTLHAEQFAKFRKYLRDDRHIAWQFPKPTEQKDDPQ